MTHPLARSPAQRLGLAPVLFTGVVLCVLAVELVAIWALSRNRYVALQLLDGGWPLLVHAHSLSKLLLVFCAAAAAAVFIDGRNRQLLLGHRPQGWLVLTHLGAVLTLLVVQQFLLPQGRPADPAVLDGLHWAYLASILAFTTVVITVALMVVPLHRLDRAELAALRRRSGKALLGAVAITVIVIFIPRIVTPLLQRSAFMEVFTDLVEDTTLNLSLYFYTLPGFAPPEITYAANGDPVMFLGEFAIQMAPNCAGYQGMMISVAALAFFIALDWRRLNLPRAALLAVATVAAVFVMNSVRIALLLGIGIHISEQVAVNGFHSYFGTISLLAVVGTSLLILQHPMFDRRAAPAVAGGPRAAATAAPQQRPLQAYADLAPLLLPLAAMLAVSFVVMSFQGEFNWFYVIPAVTGAALMWVVRDRILPEMQGSPTLAGLLCGVLVYVLWMAMIPPDPERVTLFEDAFASVATPVVVAWIVVRVLGSSIVVPVLEELAFRAGLQRMLQRAALPHLGGAAAVVLAVALSSLAFGLMHADVLAATLAGLAYGALAAWRGRIGDAIIAHAVTNFLIAMHVIALGEWSYW